MSFLSHDDLPRRRKDSARPIVNFGTLRVSQSRGGARRPLARVDSHRAPRGSGAGVSRAARSRGATWTPVGPARDVPSSGRRLPRPQPRATIPSQTSPSAPRTLPRARPQAPRSRAPTPTAVRASPGRPQPRATRPFCRATRQPRRPPRGWISSPETLARQAGAPAFDFMRGGAGGAFLRVVRMGDVPGMDPGRPPGTEGFEPATMEAAARRIAEAATEAEKTRARRGSEARGVARGAGRQRTDVLFGTEPRARHVGTTRVRRPPFVARLVRGWSNAPTRGVMVRLYSTTTSRS